VQISAMTSWCLRPDFAIKLGFVVTPSKSPSAVRLRSSDTSAVSAKNFIKISLRTGFGVTGFLSQWGQPDPKRNPEKLLEQVGGVGGIVASFLPYLIRQKFYQLRFCYAMKRFILTCRLSKGSRLHQYNLSRLWRPRPGKGNSQAG
jgi:hypothetical protein